MNVFSRKFAAVSLGMAALSVSAIGAQFDPLFQLGRIQGVCLVRAPGLEQYEVSVEGRAYPFGTEIRTREDAQVVVHLSPTVQLRLGPQSCAVVADAPSSGGERSVRVTLTAGVVGVYSPMEDAVLPLSVQTPVAMIDHFKGRCEMRLFSEAEAHRLVVATSTADARVRGPQFSVEHLGRSAALEIVTAFDESYTGLTGKSGEFELLVERGSEDPNLTNFRQDSRVKIWRRRASVSDRLAVSVMISSGVGGSVKESFAFLQGEAAVKDTIRSSSGGEASEEVELASALDAALLEAPVVNVAPAGEGAAQTGESPAANSLWDF